MVFSNFLLKIGLKLGFLSLALAFLLFNTPIAFAQTPAITTSTNLSSTVQITPSQAATSNLPINSKTLTFAELGNKDLVVVAPVGKSVIGLNVPINWEMQPGGRLALDLDALFEVGSNKGADLKVSLNSVLIYRTMLYTVGRQLLSLPLPDTWPEKTGPNHRIEIGLNFLGNCEATSSDSVTILSDSSISFDYKSIPLVFDLAKYPYPLYAPTILPNNAYMVMPSHVTSDTLGGALALSAGLGNLTKNGLTITTVNDSLWDMTQPWGEHLLVLGTPDTNKLVPFLHNAATLPISLETRRLQLVTRGPSEVAFDDVVTYTIQITNTETQPITNVTLHSHLPIESNQASCTPQCQQQGTEAVWTIPSLGAGKTLFYTLSFQLVLTNSAQFIDFTSEIKQQKPLNVSTLHSLIKLTATPRITQTTPPSTYFFVQNNQAIPETDGIIQLAPSPWGDHKAILLLTGLTEEAILKAGRALGAKTYFPGMKGQVALIQNTITISRPAQSSPDTFSLADIGYENQSIVGAGDFDNTYRFLIPLDWILTEEAFVRIFFSHSPLLNPDSSLTLLFNAIPIGTVPLNEANIADGELSSKIPTEAVRPGQLNTLTVHVESRLGGGCKAADSLNAWVNVENTSMVYLPHFTQTVASQLNLVLLPLPFTIEDNLSNVMMSLPDDPTLVEYNAAIQIMSRFGFSTEGDNFRPSVLLGKPRNVTALTDFHLVAIGRPSRNPMLQMLNRALPQPFVPNTDTIQQQIDEIIFRLPPNIDLGYLQLLMPTWESDHAILAVTGTSDTGLTWAAETLYEGRLGLKYLGNLAMIRDLDVFAIDTRRVASGNRIKAIITAVPESTVVGTVTPTVNATLAAMTPTPPLTAELPERPLPSWLLVMVAGGFITILIILGVAYWQHRRRKQFTV